MNSVLLDFLKERNISITEVINSVIKVKNKQLIFAYISRMEGLGNKGSDVDLYVISDEVPKNQMLEDSSKVFIDVVELGNTDLDIEYWSTEQVNDLINCLNSKNYKSIGMEELKFLYRLTIGAIINEAELAKEFRNKINKSNIQERLYSLYRTGTINQMDDAIKLFYAEDYISALSIARAALDQSLAVINTANGKINMKRKWMSKIFIANNGYKGDLLERYLKLQVYCSINEANISQYVEDIIELTQEILTKSSF